MIFQLLAVGDQFTFRAPIRQALAESCGSDVRVVCGPSGALNISQQPSETKHGDHGGQRTQPRCGKSMKVPEEFRILAEFWWVLQCFETDISAWTTTYCWSTVICQSVVIDDIWFGYWLKMQQIKYNFALLFAAENRWDMIQVNVALPSGKRKSLTLEESSKVGDLRVLAQKAFWQGFLRLVAAGRVLDDPEKLLNTAGIQDGDHLTAVAQQAKLAATEQAFALWCCGGDRLLTWGNRHFGGHSAAVQEQFRVCSRLGPQVLHSLRSWLMDQSLHGAILVLAGTALQSDSSSRTCNMSSLRTMHLLRSWLMDQSWHGAFQVIVTFYQFNIVSGVCSSFRRQVQHLLPSSQTDQSWHGAIHYLVVTAPLSRAAQQCAADSGDKRLLRCNPGWWIGGDLGLSPCWWWQLCSGG